MRCNICDRNLTDKEVSFNKDLDTWEPCTDCLDVAMDAAYSQRFGPESAHDGIILDSDFDEGYLPEYVNEYASYRGYDEDLREDY